jgi:hypothetical protein
MRLRLFEIHEQPWFPQFLRDQFVDGLQMILEVTNTYGEQAGGLLPVRITYLFGWPQSISAESGD